MTTKVRYPVGRAWIEVEAETVKEAIRGLSEYAEVFGETKCGLCGGDRVLPTHRNAKGYDFYEIVCLSCGAKLSFGQTKEGERLFPKRRDQGGEIGTNGWHQYQAERQSQNEGYDDPPREF